MMTTSPPGTGMDDARLTALLDSYGADPSRWPEPEREAARVRLAASTTLHERAAEAERLDRWLDALPVPATSAGLRHRLTALPDRRVIDWRALLWPFGELWRPVGGLAAAGLVGLMIGLGDPFATATDGPVDAPIDPIVSASLATVGVADPAGVVDQLGAGEAP